MNELFEYPNVVGFGQGFRRVRGIQTEQRAFVVLVTEKVPEVQLGPRNMIPAKILDQQTDVLPVGTIRALVDRTARHRPAPGGVSIGHKDITAGTFGVLARDKATNREMILSNNHVLANSNAGQPGDEIYQPGPLDGGTRNDWIAVLTRYVPIDFGQGGCLPILNKFAGQPVANLVDAAVATPLNHMDILDTILEIGTVVGEREATLTMPVRKSGRTTGLLHSSVQVVGATVQVQYGAGKIATFEDQFITGPMSAGGDSGSLVVFEDRDEAVGLLFAGSDEVTICNKIANVTDLLEITI